MLFAVPLLFAEPGAFAIFLSCAGGGGVESKMLPVPLPKASLFADGLRSEKATGVPPNPVELTLSMVDVEPVAKEKRPLPKALPQQRSEN